jgi:DNA-binding MarR family transcriptional regulator
MEPLDSQDKKPKKSKKDKKGKKAEKALRKVEKQADAVRSLVEEAPRGSGKSKRTSNHTTEAALRRDLVRGWAAAARAWGMAPACAEVHAHLLIAEGPVTTDDAMGALGISRGSAHTHLTGLVRDGFAQVVAVEGSRRRGFVAVRDEAELVRAAVLWRLRVEWGPLEALDRVARSPAAGGELGAGTARMVETVREVAGAARRAEAVLLHLFGPPEAGN